MSTLSWFVLDTERERDRWLESEKWSLCRQVHYWAKYWRMCQTAHMTTYCRDVCWHGCFSLRIFDLGDNLGVGHPGCTHHAPIIGWHPRCHAKQIPGKKPDNCMYNYLAYKPIVGQVFLPNLIQRYGFSVVVNINGQFSSMGIVVQMPPPLLTFVACPCSVDAHYVHVHQNVSRVLCRSSSCRVILAESLSLLF